VIIHLVQNQQGQDCPWILLLVIRLVLHVFLLLMEVAHLLHFCHYLLRCVHLFELHEQVHYLIFEPNMLNIKFVLQDASPHLSQFFVELLISAFLGWIDDGLEPLSLQVQNWTLISTTIEGHILDE